jgi:hypothetical protein
MGVYITVKEAVNGFIAHVWINGDPQVKTEHSVNAPSA